MKNCRRKLGHCFLIASLLFLPSLSWSASIFLTGHDPDFHALRLTENAVGAQNINRTAINFILTPGLNSFVDMGVNKFLFVEAVRTPPGGHLNGVNGIIQSGFSLGTDFEHHGGSTLNGELDLLGSKYSGIVVASDFGGLLTQTELDILNSRSTDIIDFLNAGGGLYALAESNGGARLTPNGGHFGFLPFVVSSTAFNRFETGNAVTAFGTSLGLANSDVNGNFSHNIFLDDFGLNVVDFDRFGNILSLAGRGDVDPDGGVTPGPGPAPIPEPATVLLFGSGLIGLMGWQLAKSRKARG